MEYKLKFENGRSCEIYCESDGKPLQDKINAAEERFGSQVKTINGKEVKEHGLGGFLVGAIIGGIAGNAVAKQGVKKTIKSVARKTTSTVKRAVDSVKKKEAPKSKRSNYIPNRLIDSIETKSGKTIENKDIIDGAHTKSNVLVSKKRVDSQAKDIDKSKKLSLQADYLSARKIKVVNTIYGRKLKGSEILDGAYVKKGVFADGGSIDSFNFKKFKLDELIAILPEDVQFMWMHVEGDDTYENYIRSYGPKYKSVKNTYWTITDYSKFELSKGEENIYLDMMVYKEDIKAPEVPYTISLYTKDNHLGLKNFAAMLIQKFKDGGSISEKVYYETPNVGSSKYTVSYYDGKKTNSDGSPFYDIAIFKSKLELNKFLDKLKSEGYRKKFKDGGSTESRPNFSSMSKEELIDYSKKNNIPYATGWSTEKLIDTIEDTLDSRYAKGGAVRKAPFKVGDMVYSYQNPNHKMRISFVEDRGVIDGVDYGWGIKVALKTDSEGNYDPKGTYSKSSKWMSQNSVSKVKKEKYAEGGKMAKGGGVDSKRYKVIIYHGGEQRDQVKYASTLDEARELSFQGEHSEIVDTKTNKLVYEDGGSIESKYTLEQDKDGSWMVLNNEKEMYVDRVFDSKDEAESFIQSRNNQRKLLGFESYFEGGGKLKWADARKGDSARVVSENKMGMIVKDYGRKFHLKFPDGTEKTYDASELEFYKLGDDYDEYAKGGGVEEKYSYPDFYKAQGGLKFDTEEDVKDFVKKGKPFVRKQLREGNFVIVYNGNQYYIAEKKPISSEYANGGSIDDYTKNLARVKVKFSNPKYDYTTSVSGEITESDARKYFVGNMFDRGTYPRENMQRVIDIEFYPKGTYAKGGMTEHGLRLGDKILKDAPYKLSEYILVEDKRENKHFVDLNRGERGKAFAKGGVIGQEITFNHWSGDVKRGTIDEVHSTGDYIVQSGFGSMLVNPDDVISMNAPAPEKKFLGIFEDGGGVGNNDLVKIPISDMEDSDFQSLQEICESNDIACYIDESEMYLITDLEQLKKPFINDGPVALDIIRKYSVEKMSDGGDVMKSYPNGYPNLFAKGGGVDSSLLTAEENNMLKLILEHSIFDGYKEIQTFTSGGGNYHTMILLSNNHIVTINYESEDIQYSFDTYDSIDQYLDPEAFPGEEKGWDNEYYTLDSESRTANVNLDNIPSFFNRMMK